MKKVLFLTPQLPFPPNSGGTIKSWKLIKYLSENYNVTLACFLKNDDEQYMDEFLSNISLDKFIYEKIEIPRNLTSLIKSYFLNIPLSIFRNFSSTFSSRIAKDIHKFDILFIDHFLMFQYVPSTFNAKVILHEHNAEYTMWEKQAKTEKLSVKKILILLESYRIKNYERQICQKATHILAAPDDIKDLTILGINKKKFSETFHLGDETLLTEPLVTYENTNQSLLYIGTLSWEANINGLLWFFKEVWPIVKRNNKNIILEIVGKNPDTRLLNATKDEKNIIFTGFVDDLKPLYRKSRVFISPLQFGSGIKVKNINAMYRGLPLVTTAVGAESINGEDKVHFLIADTPMKFADDILTLMANKTLWTKVQSNSRILMKEKYTWEIVFQTISQLL